VKPDIAIISITIEKRKRNRKERNELNLEIDNLQKL
jgi:hypothetical protein